MQKIEKFNGDIFGEIDIPSDKSITHRAFMLASICVGKSFIKNPLLAEDCLNTLKAMKPYSTL